MDLAGKLRPFVEVEVNRNPRATAHHNPPRPTTTDQSPQPPPPPKPTKIHLKNAATKQQRTSAAPFIFFYYATSPAPPPRAFVCFFFNFIALPRPPLVLFYFTTARRRPVRFFFFALPRGGGVMPVAGYQPIKNRVSALKPPPTPLHPATPHRARAWRHIAPVWARVWLVPSRCLTAVRQVTTQPPPHTALTRASPPSRARARRKNSKGGKSDWPCG
jgi:hypothetical protein